MPSRIRAKPACLRLPDLAIEIDVTHPTLDKLAIYAGLGVPEVWVYNGVRTEFYQLIEKGYVAIPTSDLFPFLTPAALVDCLHLGSSQGVNAMRRAFRARRWRASSRSRCPASNRSGC